MDKYAGLFAICLLISLVGYTFIGNDFLIPSGILLYGAFYLKHKADGKKRLKEELKKIDEEKA